MRRAVTSMPTHMSPQLQTPSHPSAGAGLLPAWSWPSVLAGAAALLLGLLVYLLLRPAWPMLLPPWLTGSAPSFLHAYAFAVWTALTLNARGGRLWAVVLGWACWRPPSRPCSIRPCTPACQPGWPSTGVALSTGSTWLLSLLAAAGVSGCVLFPWAIGRLGDLCGLRIGMLVLPVSMAVLLVMLVLVAGLTRGKQEDA